MNNQATESKEWRTDGLLQVHSIFETIQGEGPSAGTPATFIRLAGCNLQCSFCDTEYTSRDLLSIQDIVDRVKHLPSLVVITGGEPFRQNVKPLTDALFRYGKRIEIETNGTIFPENNIPMGSHFICSPKTPKIDDRFWWYAKSLKYVLRAGYVADDGLPLSSVGEQYGQPARPTKDWFGQIFIQPLDEGNLEANQRNIQASVESCLKFGYRLSVQIHKIAGVP